MKKWLVLAMVFAGCGPQWPSGSRGRSNLCELASTVDSFTLATVQMIHQPEQILVSGAERGRPSDPGEVFWGTRVDWSGEQIVAMRGARAPVEARFSTVFAGAFASNGTFIIGRAVRSEWVDLHTDAMFTLTENGWRRAGHLASSELNVLGPALSDAFAVSDCTNWVGGDM